MAVGLTFLAIGVALARATAERRRRRRADGRTPASRASVAPVPRTVRAASPAAASPSTAASSLAGLLFGLACTARLTVVFGAPFFVFVGRRRLVAAARLVGRPRGGDPARRPSLVYNLVTTGHLFHPGLRLPVPARGRRLPAARTTTPTGRSRTSATCPRTSAILFLDAPVLLPSVVPTPWASARRVCTSPDAVRGLFDLDCPLVVPRDTGMSVLLTSPAYLLAIPALAAATAAIRLVTGAALAVAR